jgi:hypothetical protein
MTVGQTYESGWKNSLHEFWVVLFANILITNYLKAQETKSFKIVETPLLALRSKFSLNN